MQHWLETIMKRLQWWDISILKLAVLFFALWLAKVWPAALSLSQWTYLAVWLVLSAYLLCKLLR